MVRILLLLLLPALFVGRSRRFNCPSIVSLISTASSPPPSSSSVLRLPRADAEQESGILNASLFLRRHLELLLLNRLEAEDKNARETTKTLTTGIKIIVLKTFSTLIFLNHFEDIQHGREVRSTRILYNISIDNVDSDNDLKTIMGWLVGWCVGRLAASVSLAFSWE